MSSQDFDVEGKSSDQSYEEFSEGLDITWQEYLATLPGGVMLCEVSRVPLWVPIRCDRVWRGTN